MMTAVEENTGLYFTGNRTVALRPVPKPDLRAEEVLIRVMATGICGSDLHVYRTDQEGQFAAGHEPSGVVEAVGEAVTFLKPGDRVAVHHHVASTGHAVACGDYVFCPNDAILGVHRQGSFSRWLAVPERNCVVLPEGVSFEDGVFMSCVGSTAYAAIRRLEVKPGQTMAVFGLGPVGLSAILIAKAMGLKVVGIDKSAPRMEQAGVCGADEVLHADDPELLKKIQRFAPATWAGKPPHPDFTQSVDGVHHAVETSGFASAQAMLIPSLRLYGKAAIVGVGNGDTILNPEDLAWKANTILGSLVFPWAWMWDLAEFMVATGMRFTPAVTHRFTLSQAEEAFAAADQAVAGKVILQPDVDDRDASDSMDTAEALQGNRS